MTIMRLSLARVGQELVAVVDAAGMMQPHEALCLSGGRGRALPRIRMQAEDPRPPRERPALRRDEAKRDSPGWR
jgi:hypothetical protein